MRVCKVNISWKISRVVDKKKEGARQWNSVFSGSPSSMPRKLDKASRWSDRPSSHKLHQRAQVNNNLSSAKLLILDFSRPSYCLVFSVKTYIKVNLEVKITRIVYASFIIAVILNSRNYLKVIKRNIKKQNLRSTATVPRKLCFKYFVLYLKIGCPYNLMLNSFKSVPRRFAVKFRQTERIKAILQMI